MVTTILSIVLATLKAIPVLKKTWDELVVMYVNGQIDKMRHADKEAIRKAVNEQDQRDLERQLFNIDPGQTSGLPGTVIRDELPNVKLQTKERRNKRNPLVK